MMYRYLLLPILLISCSGLERSERDKLRERNAVGEYVRRESSDVYFTLEEPELRRRSAYPWEQRMVGNHSRITKEHFRCKGSMSHQMILVNDESFSDCGGLEKHSLPLRGKWEFVYPIQVDLLNYIQEKTESAVIITCGHRCPTHNTYADSSYFNAGSKHMIGAEVDFYVKGYEENPEAIISLLIEYYNDDTPEYRNFQRYQGRTNVATNPWMNKEVLIKLYQKNEGRDFDNRHPHPYLCLQVRYDRENQQKILFDERHAQSCFRRY